NRTKGSQIRIANPPDQANQSHGNPVADEGLGQHRAGLAPAGYAGAHHEIGSILQDGLEKQRHLVGVITEVAIQEHDDLGVSRTGIFDPAHAGPSVSSPFLTKYCSASATCV